MYTYNFSLDTSASINRQLQRLYAWHNVRTHLNACLYTQKLGLFHHKLFVRDCPGKEDPVSISYSLFDLGKLFDFLAQVVNKSTVWK